MYTKNEAGVYTSMGPAEKIYDPGVVLDKDKGIGFVIGKVRRETGGNETIDGVATVKVTGMIDAKIIDPLVPQIGKDGGTLPVTLYIADAKAPGAPGRRRARCWSGWCSTRTRATSRSPCPIGVRR